jgi:hypothetical protein
MALVMRLSSAFRAATIDLVFIFLPGLIIRAVTDSVQPRGLPGVQPAQSGRQDPLTPERALRQCARGPHAEAYGCGCRRR